MEELAAFGLKFYKELFKEFAGDADSATITLTPDTANLTIDTTLRAKGGSQLAQMLVADPAANKPYTFEGYLDNTYAVNGLMKINHLSMQKMYDKIFDIMKTTNSDPSLADQIEKMKTLTNKMLRAMGDETAFVFSYAQGQPPLKVREVIAVKDSDTMTALTNEGLALANDLYAAMGLPVNFEYQSGVSTYKNATIDKITLAFASSDDPNNPVQAAMKQIYGGNFVYTTAHSKDKFYMAMTSDSQTDVKKLIDQNASAAATGEVKAALDTLQATPYKDFICSINVIKLMTDLGELMQSMGNMNPGGPMPDIFGGLNVPSKSSLAIGGQTANGQFGTRTILPKQHLMEIFSAAIQIQQKMMPPMPSQPQPSATPVSPN